VDRAGGEATRRGRRHRRPLPLRPLRRARRAVGGPAGAVPDAARCRQMAPLKDEIDVALVRRLRAELAVAWPAFPRQRFQQGIADELERLGHGRACRGLLACVSSSTARARTCPCSTGSSTTRRRMCDGSSPTTSTTSPRTTRVSRSTSPVHGVPAATGPPGWSDTGCGPWSSEATPKRWTHGRAAGRGRAAP
jgi:hypothetical protein